MPLLINTAYRFSLYENLINCNEPKMIIDINQLYEIIKYGSLKKEIKTLRKLANKEDYDNYKRNNLPAVTLSGIFSERKKDGLQQHSGLMQIDLDKVENYEELFRKICEDSYTYVAFKSPGGNGLKVIVKINTSAETHLSQFYALEKYYKDYFKTDIDTSCKDVSRAMLLSYDPEIYCNPGSDDFEVLGEAPQKNIPVQKVVTSKNTKVVASADDDRLVASLADELVKSNIDITSSYPKWFRISRALANSLGEQGRNYFHTISSLHPNYTHKKCDNFYNEALSDKKGLIKLGTLIHLAKEEGIYIHRGISDQKKVPQTIVKKDLYRELKKMRLEMAKAGKKPAYVIFSNKVLDQLVTRMPKTKNELMKIKGIGQSKIKEFGDHILGLINSH